ncbi:MULTISPECIES: response regulator transcription factor [unclassified Achromobacter]|uniref:response regulator transcription factor n=1 Tax=unclassified Achromobacter TaxID=2626865 RepID=UPI0008C6F291|nr:MULTISPECIES: response regulator transcription factor [unclassified Achromobacter]SEJ76846.1 two component transcriptional regulator, LuxR family [Achromobacter sp. NFACC18-2]SIT13703.1 two component transcriptional regulator, LuxR family [Achromobacter sp. MFA1 R4]
MSNPIRVIVADGHPVCVRGVQVEVAEMSHARVVASAQNSTQLFSVLLSQPCDVLVSDYVMSGESFGDGLGMLTLIQQRHPALKLIVLTSIDSPLVLQAVERLGVQGIVSKSDMTEHLRHAIQATWRGDRYRSPRIRGALEAGTGGAGAERASKLTPCEVEVVRLFLAGLTVGEIAEKFSRSKQTVSAQKRAAMRKLDVHSDSELVRYGVRNGLT